MSEIARKSVAEEEEVEKYEVEDVRENEVKRHRSMFALLTWDLGLESSHHGNRDKVTDGIKGFFILPNNSEIGCRNVIRFATVGLFPDN
ncbi:hypothetical protein Tco_1357243 [Tanacetum coccineum]